MIKINFRPEHFTGDFPPEVKPTRPGWYRVSQCPQTPGDAALRDGGFYAFYDGERWGWSCSDPNCPPFDDAKVANQNKWWAGLNFDPNALHL